MKLFVFLMILSVISGCKQKATSPRINVTKEEAFPNIVMDDDISLKSVVEVESSGASDLLISNTLSDMLASDFDLIRKSRLSVAVLDGEVLVVGGVEREDMVNTVSRIAWSLDGVKDVNNQVVVDKKPNLKTSISLDDILHNEIVRKLDDNKDIDFENYRIAVYKKKVYIMGNAESIAELRKVLSLVRRTEGIINIINYVRVKK